MMHIFNKSFWTKKKLEFIGAMVIGVFASLYVFCSSTDSGISQQITQDCIERANAYSFFQAKRIRQEINELFYINDKSELIDPASKSEAKQLLVQQEKKLKQKMIIFEDKNNPEGATQLLNKAKAIDLEIKQLNAQDSYLGMANNIYQISIILASIALVISSPIILMISVIVGLAAFSLHMYGLFTVF